jgi:hypothetical protein
MDTSLQQRKYSLSDIKEALLEINAPEGLIGDAAIDIISEVSIRVKQHPNILYVSSLVTETLYNRHEDLSKEDIIKKLGWKKTTVKEIKQNKKCIAFVLFNLDHWSLLVYFTEYDTLFHYDPITNMHKHMALQMKEILTTIQLINNQTQYIIPDFIHQQLNVGDTWSCGYHVIAYLFILKANDFIKPISKKQLPERIERFYSMYIYKSSLMRKHYIFTVGMYYNNKKHCT